MVLGIVGRKGAGKDTLANFIKKHNPDFQIYHYADRLKEICEQIFPVTHAQLFDADLKEKPFENAIHIDNYVPCIEEAVGMEVPYCGLIALSPRNLLQLVGTQYVRGARDSYWIDYLDEKIKKEQSREENRFAIVSDVRFVNEAKMIKNFNDGCLLKITRSVYGLSDRHASERGVDSVECPSIRIGENELHFSEMLAFLFAKGFSESAFSFIARSAWAEAQVV
jgi:hypothetical protein